MKKILSIVLLVVLLVLALPSSAQTEVVMPPVQVDIVTPSGVDSYTCLPTGSQVVGAMLVYVWDNNQSVYHAFYCEIAGYTPSVPNSQPDDQLYVRR